MGDVLIVMIEIKYQKYEIKISSVVIDNIIKYRQVGNNYEAGGMLIGSIVNNSNEIDLNDCTEPLKEDTRKRTSFKRSNKHNDILYNKWQKSNFTKLYLGEWHTHPQGMPKASFVDIKSWNYLLRVSNTESDILIFIIVGIYSVEIWIGDRINKNIERGGTYKYKNN